MYTYDLNGSGESEVFPLQMGDGQYTCTLYANTEGSKYAQSGRVTVSVSLSDEAAPFLAPNQEVWYTQDSAAVQKSYELCEGLSSDAEKFDAIRQFIEKKSSTISSPPSPPRRARCPTWTDATRRARVSVRIWRP